jgi:hypothetical protein
VNRFILHSLGLALFSLFLCCRRLWIDCKVVIDECGYLILDIVPNFLDLVASDCSYMTYIPGCSFVLYCRVSGQEYSLFEFDVPGGPSSLSNSLFRTGGIGRTLPDDAGQMTDSRNASKMTLDAEKCDSRFEHLTGRSRTRTLDPLIKSQLLYQLS